MIISPLKDTPNVILLRRITAIDHCRDRECSPKIDVANELKANNDVSLYTCKETDLQLFLPYDIFDSPSLYATSEQYRWYYTPGRWGNDVSTENRADSKVTLVIGSGSDASLDLAAGYEAEVVFPVEEPYLNQGYIFSVCGLDGMDWKKSTALSMRQDRRSRGTRKCKRILSHSLVPICVDLKAKFSC